MSNSDVIVSHAESRSVKFDHSRTSTCYTTDMFRQDNQQLLPLDSLIFLVVGLLFGRMLPAPLLATFLNNGGPRLWPTTSVQVITIDVLAIAVFLWLLFDRRLWSPSAAKQRFIIYAVWIGLVVGGLMLGHTFLRQASGSSRATHDGVVQSEVAARFILQGKNPYATDYRHTLLDVTAFTNVPDAQSLFTHYVYPPLVPLLTIPLVMIADVAHAQVELQYLFFGALCLAVIVLLRKVPNWSQRCLILLLTVGNPLFVLYAAAGYNDMLMFGLLATSMILLSDRHWRLAGLALGLALAAKQTAWFFLPLWAVMLFIWWRRGDDRERRRIVQHTLWTIVPAFLLYLPFLITNAPAVYDDLVRFPIGVIPGSYPIGGSTIWQYAVASNVDHYYWLDVPSRLVGAIVGLVTFALAAWQIRRQPTPAQVIMAGAGVLLAISIVNRYDYENYLAGLSFIIVVGWILARFQGSERTTEKDIDSLK